MADAIKKLDKKRLARLPRSLQPTYVMSYRRVIAESLIMSMSWSINKNLMKLLVVADEAREEVEWTHILEGDLSHIATIRLKPGFRLPPARFYYYLLYDGPYGGNEVSAISGNIHSVNYTYPIQPNLDVNHVLKRFELFHYKLSLRLAAGEARRGVILNLIKNL